MTVERAPDPAQPTPSASRADGRRLRREVNRQLVIDAMAGLWEQGDFDPSVAEVAEIAGVSARSLFRYFDDLDDLVRATVAHHVARARPHLRLDAVATDPLHDRIEELVRRRLDLWRAVGATARMARMRAPMVPSVAVELQRNRDAQRTQLRDLFRPELDRVAQREGPDAADEVLDGLDAWCSFETYDLLAHGHGRPPAAVAAAIRRGLGALLHEETS